MAEKKKNSSTRERIIENAKKHFYCDGYSKTRMQDIADDTGIALGSLSY
ncbi:TetR/AcrR family transcriptional regulator, partial [Bittarella massiliensis]|nr:TetR/AcrR family transcriptional regulator [Bittarella massiliensis (ex Durand et al. 2017)]